MVEYRILGPLEVGEDGHPLPLGRGLERTLLAVLLVHANEAVSTGRLIEALWGERPPPTAAKALQGHVSKLRKLLGEERIVTRAPGYVLRLNGDDVDADRFRELLEQGRQELAAGRAVEARATLERALGLWRGDPLAEFAYENFARGEIEQLAELRLAAFEERLDADLALARHAEAVPELERLVARHPLRERLRGLLMLALYRSGRHAEALEVYQDGRHELAENLGLEPGETLQELHRAVFARDPVLAAPRRAAGSAALPPGRRRPLTRVAVVAMMVTTAVAAYAFLAVRDGGVRGLSSVPRNSLVAIDPTTNRLTASIPVGARPVAVAVGGGAIWVGNGDDLTVTRVDPRTRTPVKTIGVGSEIAALTVGTDAVWVANGNDERITRIDPRDNVVAERIDLAVPGGQFPRPALSIATTPGALWVGTYGSDQGLLRVDLRSGAITRVLPRAGAVAAGRDAVWAGVVAGVARVHLRTGVVTTSQTFETAQQLVVGPTSVWGLGSSLWQIDRRNGGVIGRYSVGRNAVGVAVGAGSVWVASNTERVIRRIDVRTGDLLAKIPLGAEPTAIAYGEGAVWVTTR